MKTRIIILIAIFLAGFYYAKNEKEILSLVESIAVTNNNNWIDKFNEANPEIPYNPIYTKGGVPTYVKKDKGRSPVN